MNTDEKSEDDGDIIEIGLEIVALETAQIIEKLKDNVNPLSKKPSADKQSFHSHFYMNKMENLKIEKAKKQSKEKLFVSESSRKFTLSFYRNKKNKPKKNTSKQITEIFFKGTSSDEKPGPSLQAQKKNTESPSPYKRLVYSITGNKKVANAVKRISNCSSNKIEKFKPPELPCVKNIKSLAPRHNERIPITCIYSPLKVLRDKVDLAIRERKTFTVCGNFYAIRRALVSRGWVEKMRILYNTYDKENLQKLQTCSIAELLPGLRDPQKGEVYKRMIMTKLLGSHQVDFYWDLNFDCFRICSDRNKSTLINRFKRGQSSYTSKQSLCEAMKHAHWYQKPGVSMLRQPRTYCISDTEECKDFIIDFSQTAIMSLLKWVAQSSQRGQAFKVVSKDGKVSIRAYYFAVKEVLKLLRKLNHQDIDCVIEKARSYEWDLFLQDYYKIVHLGCHFNSGDLENVHEMQQTSKKLLKKLGEHFPTLKMDGIMNVWIMKPINGSRGQGIYLCRTLQYILKTIKSNVTRRYIIQKYIERPMLIFKTKFDIRQWFLISCASPLTMWIYKDCYIRFSSQLYSLQRLHESIHLTNNSIQHRYKNCSRHRSLPQSNMWDSTQFQKYLASIGFSTVYKKIIYPGMKESVIAAMLINQEKIDIRRNSFELYGCDFMLSEDFKPWLIEINSNPALFASTSVTARLCPQVLEDVIKVVIDYPMNPRASTGRFELLYQQTLERYPKINDSELCLSGKELPLDYFGRDLSDILSTTSSQTDIEHPNTILSISCEMRKGLENLLSILETQRDKKTILKNVASQSNKLLERYANSTLMLLDKDSQIENVEVELAELQYEENNNVNINKLITKRSKKFKCPSEAQTTVFKENIQDEENNVNVSKLLTKRSNKFKFPSEAQITVFKEKIVVNNTMSDYTIRTKVDWNKSETHFNDKRIFKKQEHGSIFTRIIRSLINFASPHKT